MKQRALHASPYTIDLNGEQLPVLVRKHASSRRITIRYQPLHHVLTLTLPRYVSIKQGLRFVEEKRNWILQQLTKHEGHVPFADGQKIPLFGKQYTLIHTGKLRGVTSMDDTHIYISGDPASMARRVQDFLKAQALDTINALVHKHAAAIGKKPGKVAVRDTSSRWGSCNHKANLSFSWRLIFAPYEVLDYVVCHEVAHIQELNHSDAFWAVVAKLDADWRKHRRWLQMHGAKLYVYG